MTHPTAPSKLDVRDGIIFDDDRMLTGKVAHQLFELKVQKLCGLLDTPRKKEEAESRYKAIDMDVTKRMQTETEKAAKKVAAIYATYKAASPSTTIHTEQWIHLHELIRNAKGQADVVIVTPDTVHIIDLKTGNYPIKPDSAQMTAYAAGLALKNPGKRIVSTIIQQGVEREQELDPTAAIEWAKEEGERQNQAIIEDVKDPLALELLALNEKVKQLKPEDLNGDVLFALHRLKSEQEKRARQANKLVKEHGATYSFFESKPGNRKLFAKDTLQWLADKGYTADDIASMTSVTKKNFENIVSPAHQLEAIEEGIIYDGQSPASLKLNLKRRVSDK